MRGSGKAFVTATLHVVTYDRRLVVFPKSQLQGRTSVNLTHSNMAQGRHQTTLGQAYCANKDYLNRTADRPAAEPLLEAGCRF